MREQDGTRSWSGPDEGAYAERGRTLLGDPAQEQLGRSDGEFCEEVPEDDEPNIVRGLD
ncbi:hypothetical protein ACFV3R_28955 [Streptomyces sp. NPDC059740]|uniref:hypothetical protein n=1 Tax=Streptomyces sp. NPDC059740 TaxID=3346926 RepID=UPI003664A665